MTPPPIYRDTDGEYPGFAWPGGYPVFYLCRDGGALCASCANVEDTHECSAISLNARCAQADAQWCLIAGECNWEDPSLYCDHCGGRIESAYAEDEASA